MYLDQRFPPAALILDVVGYDYISMVFELFFRTLTPASTVVVKITTPPHIGVKKGRL
jgi:hypothetical protein